MYSCKCLSVFCLVLLVLGLTVAFAEDVSEHADCASARERGREMFRHRGNADTELGDPSSWTEVGSSGEFGMFGRSSPHYISSNATEVVAGRPDGAPDCILKERLIWGMSKETREKDRRQVDAVLPDVQKKLDAFLPKWLGDGNLLDGRPLNGPGRRFGKSRTDGDRLKAIKFGNCRKVLLALLVGDKGLLEKCRGLPFEPLVERLRFPEPRLEERDLKMAFEKWATARWDGQLTEKERKRLFVWQLYVVEHEKRPWVKLALACNEAEGDEEAVVAMFGGNARERLKQTVDDKAKAFADFEHAGISAADFVESWYKKAVAAGMTPSDEDKRLLEKARFSKAPRTINPNIAFADGFLSRKVKIRGKVSAEELKEASNALFGGLGADERTRITLELDETDAQTLKDAFGALPARQVVGCLIRGSEAHDVDISSLVEGTKLRAVELRGCKIGRSVSLSACKGLGAFAAKDCTLGDLKFLSGCVALTQVSLESCSFSNLGSLWASERLTNLAVPNSKDVVDLSVVRKLERLFELDISGCRVTNFEALKGHPSLRRLKMEHLKGGVDSLSVLMGNEQLATVEYLKEDFQPSAYAEFERVRRKREHGDDPERMLEEAVKDRDLQEIRNLCKGDIKTDDALSDFKFTSEEDVDVFRLLVPKATERALTRQLDQLLGAFGYGHSFDKPSYVPTNRIELVTLLLKHGANAEAAAGKMFYPSKTDLELFELLIGKAPKEVRSELLQKNIKAFGNHDFGRRETTHSADRLEVVRLLLKHGADPNACNFFGKTALGNAIEYDGDMQLVRLLLDNGAEAASLYPKQEVFRSFYQGRERVWGTNRYELVELLFSHGLDANVRGKSGKTPLGELVFFGGRGESYDLKMVEILLKHGADPNASQGRNFGSATDMAYGRFGADELLALLQKKGGKVSEEAKRKKTESHRNDRNGNDSHEGMDEMRRPRFDRPRRRPDSADERMDPIRAEMERHRVELRECTSPEERRKCIDEHMERMRKLH